MAEKSVLTDDSDRVTRVPSTLTDELAALSLAILDTRAERTETNKKYNSRIKKLEARQRDVATQIRAGGIQLELSKFEGSADLADLGDDDTEDSTH